MPDAAGGDGDRGAATALEPRRPTNGKTADVSTTTPGNPPDNNVRVAWLREAVHDSLWVLPLLFVLGSVALWMVMHQVDQVTSDGAQPSFAFVGEATGAQQVLSTIASSTMAFTGLVFSITVVALQLASQQFSPRVMRTFFRDTGTKVCLGVFVATFVYALLVLRTVRPPVEGEGGFIPGLSITVAFGLALASLGTFVFYVNHITHSIRVVSIIERVAGETRRAIRATRPDDQPSETRFEPARPADVVLCFEHAPGYLLGVDEDDLVHLAVDHRCVLRLLPRVGDYLPSGVAVFGVWADDPGDDPPTVTTEAVIRHLGVGWERTMRQDLAFGFRQLVDVAEKALSPSINDPTTAVQCLDRIHDLLRRIAVRPTPSGCHHGPDGQVRLVVPVAQWDELVALALDEIRQYGHSSIQVHRRMRSVIDDLSKVATVEHRPALERQRTLLAASADRAFPDGHDRRTAESADSQGMGDDRADQGDGAAVSRPR